MFIARRDVASVIILMILALLILALRLGIIPVSLAAVDGESMLPTVREGDLVILLKVSDPSEIKVGDVVVYRSVGDRLIIHRVIEVLRVGDEYFYVTKGDNNFFPDIGDSIYGVSFSRIVGKVFSINGHIFKVPYLGYLSLWFRSS